MYVSIVPAAAPEQASGSSPTSTSIVLTWSPPPAVSINGIIDYYVVEIMENRTGRSWTLHSPNLYLTLGSLHPYYVYVCRVAAFTVGRGPFTPYFEVITAEDGKCGIAMQYSAQCTLYNGFNSGHSLSFLHKDGV